jgi:phenylalanyl-tRNA synthetase alpha chain
MAKHVLTDEGRKYLSGGLPEVKLAEYLSGGARGVADAKKHVDNFNVALLWAKKNGWVAIENGSLRLTAKPETDLPDKLRMINEGGRVDNESLSVLVGRRLVEEDRMTLDKQAQKLVGKEVANLSRELIATGKWKDVRLKPYNVEAAAKTIYPGKKHHYTAFLDWVKAKMVSLGFSCPSSIPQGTSTTSTW